MSETANNTVPVTTSATGSNTGWQGLTLEELRMRRAKALLRREVGKVKVNATLEGMRTRVNDNGLRGLMASNNALTHLKTADFVFLGWQLARLLLKLRRKRK